MQRQGGVKNFQLSQPTSCRLTTDPWGQGGTQKTSKLFTVLTVLKYLLSNVASRSQWHIRLKGLIEEYSDIPASIMGFPANWKECLFWKDVSVDGIKQ